MCVLAACLSCLSCLICLSCLEPCCEVRHAVEAQRPFSHARRGRDGCEEGCEGCYYYLRKHLDDSVLVHRFIYDLVNLQFSNVQCTIYVQFSNLAIYSADGNFDFSLFTFHFSLFTCEAAR